MEFCSHLVWLCVGSPFIHHRAFLGVEVVDWVKDNVEEFLSRNSMDHLERAKLPLLQRQSFQCGGFALIDNLKFAVASWVSILRQFHAFLLIWLCTIGEKWLLYFRDSFSFLLVFVFFWGFWGFSCFCFPFVAFFTSFQACLYSSLVLSSSNEVTI